jgi:hypothetical protein
MSEYRKRHHSRELEPTIDWRALFVMCALGFIGTGGAMVALLVH